MGLYDSFKLKKSFLCPCCKTKNNDGQFQTKTLLNLMFNFKENKQIRFKVSDGSFTIGKGYVIAWGYCNVCEQTCNYKLHIKNEIWNKTSLIGFENYNSENDFRKNYKTCDMFRKNKKHIVDSK